MCSLHAILDSFLRYTHSSYFVVLLCSLCDPRHLCTLHRSYFIVLVFTLCHPGPHALYTVCSVCCFQSFESLFVSDIKVLFIVRGWFLFSLRLKYPCLIVISLLYPICVRLPTGLGMSVVTAGRGRIKESTALGHRKCQNCPQTVRPFARLFAHFCLLFCCRLFLKILLCMLPMAGAVHLRWSLAT